MSEESLLQRWFADYLNPSDEELKLWMEDPESFEPGQDWHIIVSDGSRLSVFVKLANDDGPRREDIVHYFHVSPANAFHHDRSQILEGGQVGARRCVFGFSGVEEKSVVSDREAEFVSTKRMV